MTEFKKMSGDDLISALVRGIALDARARAVWPGAEWPSVDVCREWELAARRLQDAFDRADPRAGRGASAETPLERLRSAFDDFTKSIEDVPCPSRGGLTHHREPCSVMVIDECLRGLSSATGSCPCGKPRGAGQVYCDECDRDLPF